MTVARSFQNRMLLIPVLSVVILFVFALGTYSSLNRTAATSEWIDHTYEVLAITHDVSSGFSMAESSNRGYVITGYETYQDAYNKHILRTERLLAKLLILTRDNPLQSMRVRHIDSLTHKKFEFMNNVAYARLHLGKEVGQALFGSGEGQKLMDYITEDLQEIRNEEERLLHMRSTNNHEATNHTYLIVTIECILAVMLMAAATLIILRYVKKKSRQVNEIRMSEKQYRLLVETMKEGMIYIDKDNNICFVNQQFCSIVEYSREELLGSSVLMLIPPGEQKSIEEKLSLRKKGISDQYEIALQKKSGEIIWTAITAKPIMDEQGQLMGTIATHLDITDKRNAKRMLEKSERKYRELVTHLQAFICMHDMDGVLLSVNPAIIFSLGYEGHEMVGRSIADFLSPEFRSEFSLYLKSIAGPRITHGLMALVTKSGEKKVWSYSNIRMEREDGVSYIVASALDITDRVEIARELKKAKLVAEESSRAKEQFMANMSHEIRTPMNAVIGFTELLQQSSLDREQKEFVTAIRSSGESLLAIINDILDYSKIQSGMMQLEKVPFSISKLMGSVHMMLMQRAKQKDLSFLMEQDPALPQYVIGDPTRLTQVLINLTGNAIKFTENGSVTLSAKVTGGTSDVPQVTFTVSDTGIGIAHSKQQEVFERFTQERTDTTRKYGGTGLGLSIARQLVHLQGGEMRLQSEPGKGSEFVFTISYRKAMMNEIPEANTITVPDEGLRGTHVLLVEDNEMNRKLAVKVLGNMGVFTDVAVNGREGVVKLEANDYDLVLMDIQMPVMDGYETARFVRSEMKKSIPIIAMTAHAMAGEKEKCLKIGMNDYISKPFRPAELYAKIFSLVKDRQRSAVSKVSRKIDLTYLSDLAGDDTGFLEEMLGLFVERIPSETEQLVSTSSNADANRKVAHRLKPIVSYVGYEHVTSALNTLETGEPLESERGSLSRFVETELAAAVEQASEVLHGMKKAG